MVSPAVVVNKRPSSPSSYMAASSPKRQKTTESSGDTIQRSELDSALALAALALNSPRSNRDQENRDASDGTSTHNKKGRYLPMMRRVSSSNDDGAEQDETRGPSGESAPVTPKHSPSKSRRVQFTSSREEGDEDHHESPAAPAVTPSPSSRLSRKRRPMVFPAHHRNAPPPHPPLHHSPLNHPQHAHRFPPPPLPYNRSAPPGLHPLYHRHPPPPPYRHHMPPPPIGYPPHHPAAHPSPYAHPAAHRAWGHPPPPHPHAHAAAAAAYHRRAILGPPPPSPRAPPPSISHTASVDSSSTMRSTTSTATATATATTTTTTLSTKEKTNSRNSKKSTNHDWVCDYCNQASFSSYEEACAHEDVCKHKYAAKDQGRNPEDTNTSTRSSTASRDSREPDGGDARDQVDKPYFSGCVPLAVEAADSEWLSELNCYVRKHCIEAFSAQPEDILKTSKRGRIGLHQVGIRCKFCAHRPLAEKAVAAVSYPTSLQGIYESVKRWQRVHLPACLDVSDEAQAKLDALREDTAWVPTTRQYWTDAARALGMVDTHAEGIRFEREPSPLEHWMPTSKTTMNYQDEQQQQQQQQDSSLPASSSNTAMSSPVATKNESKGTKTTTMSQQQSSGSGGYICFPEDQAVIPPYVYFLMRQVEPCYFTEADRFVARSKGPVGFAGFQCRHCQGHAGLGKYFPHHSKALSTNSTSQNIHAHILKCRKTTSAVKEELVYLKNEKMKSPRLVPGWRKTFFERVWERLHGDQVNM
mmetsp:Transcript_16349/g.24082  ORF Transcript_16349/g.24082 Transcript_16349/m.24082 type:complete len:754 (+) Transcript_16349:78-2339(+)